MVVEYSLEARWESVAMQALVALALLAQPALVNLLPRSGLNLEDVAALTDQAQQVTLKSLRRLARSHSYRLWLLKLSSRSSSQLLSSQALRLRYPHLALRWDRDLACGGPQGVQGWRRQTLRIRPTLAI